MNLSSKKILVTGCAGFIGSALVRRLVYEKANVIGIDNINDYYSVDLKLARLEEIKYIEKESKGSFDLYKISLEDFNALKLINSKYDIDIVVHLAAQAGVRHSLINPHSYIDANLVAFGNILEICKDQSISNFVFASSSSVYGGNKLLPFKENHVVNCPLNLYAATKRSNELMAFSYSHLYKIPTTGLRFFTVYGPWGRPDMAPFIFTDSIFKGSKINIFNNGKMSRDFTFIDDIVEGVFRCCQKPATPEVNSKSLEISAPYRIFNIGNGSPIDLMDFIKHLEDKIGIKAQKEYLKMQDGDVVDTWASTKNLKDWIDYKPKTSVKDGISSLVEWYKKYYKL